MDSYRESYGLVMFSELPPLLEQFTLLPNNDYRGGVFGVGVDDRHDRGGMGEPIDNFLGIPIGGLLLDDNEDDDEADDNIPVPIVRRPVHRGLDVPFNGLLMNAEELQRPRYLLIVSKKGDPQFPKKDIIESGKLKVFGKYFDVENYKEGFVNRKNIYMFTSL
ncbi:unnamed protein product [Ambrosiozyma monospora]|uniref:Unnamed protein product n=1 Tax=Ambrosiozyma monospora TaxID=43982 RepID=A0ACB5SXS4_AMBMO|nr:unnamed protein product [Ambrosiozyma monospora]